MNTGQWWTLNYWPVDLNCLAMKYDRPFIPNLNEFPGKFQMNSYLHCRFAEISGQNNNKHNTPSASVWVFCTTQIIHITFCSLLYCTVSRRFHVDISSIWIVSANVPKIWVYWKWFPLFTLSSGDDCHLLFSLLKCDEMILYSRLSA